MSSNLFSTGPSSNVATTKPFAFSFNTQPTTNASGGTSASTNLFGTIAGGTVTSQPAAGIFGSVSTNATSPSSGLFSFKPTTTSANVAPGTGGVFNFGQPSTGATTGVTGSGPFSGLASSSPFTFGSQPTSTAVTTMPTSTTGSTGSGFSFGVKPAANVAPPAGGLFSGLPSAPTVATIATTTSASSNSIFGTSAITTTSGVVPTTGFSFGTPSLAPTTGLNLGTTTASSSAPKTGFSFGAPNTVAFGSTATTGGGLFSTPVTSTQIDVKPQIFGTQPITTPATVSTTTASSGFSFGLSAASVAQSTTQAISTATAFTALTSTAPVAAPSLFGPKPATLSTTVTPAVLVATINTSTINTTNFQTPSQPPKPTPSQPPKPTTTAASAVSQATLSFGVSAPITGNAAVAQLNTTTAQAPLSAQAPLASIAQVASVPQTTASSAVPSSNVPQVASAGGHVTSVATPLTYGDLETKINQWTLDVEHQEREFLNKAAEINVWDRMLMENGDKIVELGEKVNDLEKEHLRIDYELDFVAQQQAELNRILIELETTIVDEKENRALSLGGGGSIYYGADQREKMIQQQINLDCQLKQIGSNLEQVTEKIDDLLQKEAAQDPMKQIGQLIGKQMDALQWIAEQTSEIQCQVDGAKKELDFKRKQQSFNRIA